MTKFGTRKFGTFKFGAATTTLQEDTLGQTHYVMLDELGINTAGVISKSDITSAIPRISIGSEQRKHTDFSERDTFGQNSFHHGRAQRDLLDPLAFGDSTDLMTWISSQVTLMPKSYQMTGTMGSPATFGAYVTDVLPYNGNLYFLMYGISPADNQLRLYDNTNDEMDAVTAGMDTVTGEPLDLHVWRKDTTASTNILLVAQGETVNARRYNGTSWSDLGVPASFFATFDNKCWRADNLNELYHSSDVDVATPTWSSVIEVGDANYPIRGMLAGFMGALWVAKDDGIYAVRWDTQLATPAFMVTKEIDLSHVINSNNGKAMMQHAGHLYISVRNGLMRYDGQTIQYIGPDQNQEGISMSQVNPMGPIVGLAHDNNFIYAGIQGGTGATDTSYVMAWGGTGWHKVVERTNGQIYGVFFTSALATTGRLSYPGLWWSEKQGSTNGYLFNKKLPRFTQDPLIDTTIEYESTGNLITSWFDAGLLDIKKILFDFVVRAKSLGDDSAAGNRILLEFQVDDVDTWYTMGTAVHSPEQTLYFPDNSLLDSTMYANKIRYRITLTRSSTTTSTPVLQSWAHRFVVRPEPRFGWTMTCRVYDGMYDYARRLSDRDAQDVREFLYSKRAQNIPVHLDEATAPETLTNLFTNPSFELDSNGDGTSDGVSAVGTVTFSRTAQFRSHGVYAQKVAISSGTGTHGISLGTYTVDANVPIFASAHVYVQLGDRVYLEVLDGTSAVVGSEEFVVPGATGGHVQRTRLSRGFIFFTPTTSGTYTLRIVRRSADAGNPTTFYVDGVEFIHQTGLTRINDSYIDGDVLRCRWTGAPHASTSVRQHGYYVYITGLTEAIRYVEDRQASVVPNSEITLQLRETL